MKYSFFRSAFLVLILSFTACGNDDELLTEETDYGIIGEWHLTKAYNSQGEINLSLCDRQARVQVPSRFRLNFIYNDSESCNIKSNTYWLTENDYYNTFRIEPYGSNPDPAFNYRDYNILEQTDDILIIEEYANSTVENIPEAERIIYEYISRSLITEEDLLEYRLDFKVRFSSEGTDTPYHFKAQVYHSKPQDDYVIEERNYSGVSNDADIAISDTETILGFDFMSLYISEVSDNIEGMEMTIMRQLDETVLYQQSVSFINEARVGYSFDYFSATVQSN